MAPALIDEEWTVLARLLPKNWQMLARETGAMRRARGEIKSPEMLLQLLLLHVATGLSLKQTVARAAVQGLASLSDVALLKRLRNSERWLQELGLQMFKTGRFARALPAGLKGHRVRAVDATTIEEPGATGTDWRVHYVIALPELSCDFYELTDVKGVETYKRVPVAQGDIILGDRGYCHREGVAHVVRQQGDVVVRLNSTAFPLLKDDGQTPFDLLAHLRTLSGSQPAEWAVSFAASGSIFKARLCAIRKSAVAAELAKKKIRNKASKRGTKLKPETLEFAEYVFVLTTLRRDLLDAASILALYRARWQIELCFKRLKSLLRLGHLPKRSDASARAWIQGKLVTVLLIERLIDEATFFSPWGFPLQPQESMERIAVEMVGVRIHASPSAAFEC